MGATTTADRGMTITMSLPQSGNGWRSVGLFVGFEVGEPVGDIVDEPSAIIIKVCIKIICSKVKIVILFISDVVA